MILASLTRLCGDGFAVPDRAFICGSNRNVRAQESKRFLWQRLAGFSGSAVRAQSGLCFTKTRAESPAPVLQAIHRFRNQPRRRSHRDKRGNGDRRIGPERGRPVAG